MKEAMKLALEALTYIYTETTADEDELIDQAITAIKKALAQPDQYAKGYADAMNWKTQNHLEHLPVTQPEQEPVAFASHGVINWIADKQFQHEADLYTTPPQRTWVGLTTTQVKLLWEGVEEEAIKSGDSLNWVFYTHINEALKEKNT